MAAVVETYLMREFCAWDRLWLDNIMQELYEIHCLLCCLALVVNDTRVEESYVCSATGRWCHYVVILCEKLVIVVYELFSLLLETSVTHRLSTACLFLRVVNVETKGCQELESSYTNLRIQCIDVAWYE